MDIITKYYTLYKVDYKKDTQIINDIKYLYEVSNYNDITKMLNISKSNILKMINKNANNFNQLKTYKNYCIIKE